MRQRKPAAFVGCKKCASSQWSPLEDGGRRWSTRTGSRLTIHACPRAALRVAHAPAASARGPPGVPLAGREAPSAARTARAAVRPAPTSHEASYDRYAVRRARGAAAACAHACTVCVRDCVCVRARARVCVLVCVCARARARAHVPACTVCARACIRMRVRDVAHLLHWLEPGLGLGEQRHRRDEAVAHKGS